MALKFRSSSRFEVVYPVRAPVEVIDCGLVVGVVVAVAIMVAAVIVTAVPGGISVEVIVVVDHRAAVPVTIPGIPSPSAATAARKRTEGDSSAEPDHAGGRHISRGVSRGDVGIAIDYCRIVFRNIYDLRVRGLDDDGLRRLLYHRDLGSRLEIARSLGFGAQRLNGRHHLRRLVVIGLSQRGGPGEILRQIVEDRRKLGKCLHARIPRLFVDGLHERRSRQVLVLRGASSRQSRPDRET